MAIQPMALEVQNPKIDVLGAYDQSRNNAIDQKTAQINQQGAQQQQDAAALQQMAEVGFGAMDGNLDGPIDPNKVAQLVQILHGNPLAAAIQKNPELLRTITKGSLEVLKYKDNAEQFELAKKKLEAELQKASQPTEVSAGASLMDPVTGKVVGTAPVNKSTSLPTSYQEYELAKSDPEYAKTLASSSSKPPTDAQRRASQLTEVVKPDAELLLGDGSKENPGIFDALSNAWDQAGAVLTGNRLSGEDYQRAANAVGNIAQSYLYAVSGQAAPAAEVAKIVDSVSPKFGDKPQTLKEKKARLKSYVDAIALGQKQGVNAPQPDAPAAAPNGGDGKVVDWTEFF